MKSNLTMLLDSISEFEVLDEKEEKEYLSLAQEGDVEARNKMINHNLKLVVNVAKKFNNRGVELDDLIQEGSEGLVDAIYKFDLNSGNKFSTYAYFWIIQRVYKVIQNKSRLIRVPVYIHRIINNISLAKEKFLREGIEPTIEEIAREIGEEPPKVKVALRYMKTMLSLEYESQKTEFANTLEQNLYPLPEGNFEDKEIDNERRRAIFDALETLSERSQEVIILRYGLDLPGHNKRRTLKEVSDIVGISKERVRQLLKKSLETLREGGGRTDRRRRLQEFY